MTSVVGRTAGKPAEGGDPGSRTTVTVTVNETPVVVSGPKASGLQIKEAAIAAGVQIDLAFVLQEELANRRTRIVADHDEVTVNKNSRFLAVAPDDNS